MNKILFIYIIYNKMNNELKKQRGLTPSSMFTITIPAKYCI